MGFAPTTRSAGPGGVVRFTISNLLPGARWTVSVDGQGVAGGTATGDGVAGAFTMPNLGGTTRTVQLAAMVDHADIDNSPWTAPSQMEYVAPAAAQTTAQQPPAADQAAGAAAETGSEEAPPPASTATQPSRPRTRPGTSRPSRLTPAPRVSAGKHASVPIPVREALRGSTVRAASGSIAAAGVAAPAKQGSLRVGPRAQARGRSHPRSQGVGPRLQPAPRVTPFRAVPPMTAARGRRVAWLPLGIVLLAFVIAAGGAFLARRRRRPLAPPQLNAGDLALEAELQEIIAEERARQATRAHEPD